MDNAMSKYIGNEISNALMVFHVAYIGEVVSVNGTRATIQPLMQYQYANEQPKEYGVQPNVPCLEGLVLVKGDLCLCLCCDKDVSQAIKGQSAVQHNKHHSLSNSIVIGKLPAEQVRS